MHPMLNIAVRAARFTGNVIIFVGIMLAGILCLVSQRRVCKTSALMLSAKLLPQSQPLYLLRCFITRVRHLRVYYHHAGRPDNSRHDRVGPTYSCLPANRFSFTTAVLSLLSVALSKQACAATGMQGAYGHSG